MTCDTDADCLQGLFCVHGDDVDCSAAALPPARDVDAGSPRPEPASCSPSDPSEGVCTYRFAECAKDGDCSGGFVCSALGEPNELHCFPPRVDCETDDDCDGDTRCAALSDDAREDPPAAWEGATALCVPEAIALLLEERVMAAGIGESASKSGGSQSDANASDDGDDRAPVDGDSPQTDANSAGSEPAREATDSGCAVTHAGAGGANAAWLSLLGVAALVRRRH
jgi:MYXO-CTERM domain-containing protein